MRTFKIPPLGIIDKVEIVDLSTEQTVVTIQECGGGVFIYDPKRYAVYITELKTGETER